MESMNWQIANALGRCALLSLAALALLCPITPMAIQAQNPYPGFGTNVASPLGMLKTAAMGFRWVRIYYPEQVNEAEKYGLKVLLLLGWEFPLSDVPSWGDYVYEIVSRYRGRIAAYQICNEPNLAEMWHKPQHADPAEYVAFLREAYIRAKQADPNCIIVSAGMAVNGGYGSLAMDNVEFIRGMYAAGAKPYFDVLGSHPYGFAYPPEDNWSNPIHCFRRVEQERAVMLQYGDVAKPVWATEFGWITDPGDGCHNYDGWPSRWWQRVPAETQASYLRRAFDYARANWPWMGVMFVWNMDYSLVPWNDYCDQKAWFAILNNDGSPRPAYWELARLAQGPSMPTVTATPQSTATHTLWPTATLVPPTATPERTTTPAAAHTPLSTAIPTNVPGTGIIIGRVLLQGRNNHSGVSVSVSEYNHTTGTDGTFRFERVPAGMYELRVQMAGYLQHRQSGLTIDQNETMTLPDILLRAGDINGDGVVNLFDLVALSTHYGLQMPAGTAEDVNGDGEVTLLDLVLVSSNYGASH